MCSGKATQQAVSLGASRRFLQPLGDSQSLSRITFWCRYYTNQPGRSIMSSFHDWNNFLVRREQEKWACSALSRGGFRGTEQQPELPKGGWSSSRLNWIKPWSHLATDCCEQEVELEIFCDPSQPEQFWVSDIAVLFPERLESITTLIE